MTDINFFVVKVFVKGKCIITDGPRNLSAAIEIYRKYLRQYTFGFETDKEGFGGHFQLEIYTDEWINRQLKENRNDESIIEVIQDISQDYLKGHVRIRLFHELKENTCLIHFVL